MLRLATVPERAPGAGGGAASFPLNARTEEEV